MTTDDLIKSKLQRLRVETTAELDARILAAARRALTAEPSSQNTESGDPAMTETQTAVPTGTRPSTENPAPRSKRRGRTLAAIVAGLAVVAAGSVLFQSGPAADSYAWADVADAVRQRPWIVMQGKNPDGTQTKSWMSFSRKIYASKNETSGEIHFHDLRQGLRWRYDPQEKVLLRSPIPDLDEQLAGMALFANLFGELFRADENLKLAVPKALQERGVNITAEQRRTVADGGRDWFEYELRVTAGDDDEAAKSLVFRVDPETKLPVSMKHKQGGQNAAIENATVEEVRLSFPDDGPADVYALDVERDVPVADSKAPHSGVPEAAGRLVEAIEQSAERLDNFAVLVVDLPAEGAWHEGFLTKRWKKGDRVRTEMAVLDADRPLVEGPPDPQNLRAWWQARWDEAAQVPTVIYNNGTAYQNEGLFAALAEFRKESRGMPRGDVSKLPEPKWTSRPWEDARILPVSQVYPQGIGVYMSRQIVGTPRVTVEHNPPDGPPGTILLRIEREWENAEWGRSHRRWAYWIDPNRSHMVVQWTDDFNQRDAARIPPYRLTGKVPAAIRRDDGLWFPTQIRIEYRFPQEDQKGDPQQTENERPQDRNENYDLFYDFESPIPDELFEVEE